MLLLDTPEKSFIVRTSPDPLYRAHFSQNYAPLSCNGTATNNFSLDKEYAPLSRLGKDDSPWDTAIVIIPFRC
jgi:hypothetical protein